MATNNSVNTSLAGQTGTGTFAGSTSPTITGIITDTVTFSTGTRDIKSSDGFTAFKILNGGGTSVNYAGIAGSATGIPPALQLAGTDADVGFQINLQGAGIFLVASTSSSPFNITSGTAYQHSSTFTFANTAANRTYTFPDATGTMLLTGQAISTVPSIAFSTTSGVIGTTTNDNAAAASVGELISSSVTESSTSLTTNTAANVTSISLTAGDWDVWGNVVFVGATTTLVQYTIGWISSTSATIPASNLFASKTYGSTGVAIYNALQDAYCVPSRRFSLSGTTTVYLTVQSGFTVSTSTGGGAIYARRRR